MKDFLEKYGKDAKELGMSCTCDTFAPCPVCMDRINNEVFTPAVHRRRNIDLGKLSNHVRNTGSCTEEAALHLMDEIQFLRKELSHGWQQSFYHAQHTIELQKKRISGLERSDQVFRHVIEKLTADNNGMVPNWLLDLEI